VNQTDELIAKARIIGIQDCEIIVLEEAKKLREWGEMKAADVCMDIAEKMNELRIKK